MLGLLVIRDIFMFLGVLRLFFGFSDVIVIKVVRAFRVIRIIGVIRVIKAITVVKVIMLHSN